MRSFTAGENDAGQRADKFLSKAVPLLPKNLMYRYIRQKRIKINGRRCEISQKIQVGDVIDMYINDEFFESKSDRPFLRAPAQTDIIYEDENILIANKKSGLAVHADESGGCDTLIDRIRHYLYNKGEYDPDGELSFAPALCNRIDRNTTGLVICAKNAESLRILDQKIKDREVKKSYLCVCLGIPTPREGTITTYLEKDEKTKTVRVVKQKTPRSRTAVTKYKVLAQSGELALCEVQLVTGRTHQIRVHMAHIGCPLLGDGKYGRNEANRKYGVKTQALQSHRLVFDLHGDSGILEYLNGREFCAPKPWFIDKYFKNTEVIL